MFNYRQQQKKRDAKHVQIVVYENIIDGDPVEIERSPIFDSYFSKELREWADNKMHNLPGASTDWESDSYRDYDFYYMDVDKNICIEVDSVIENLMSE